MENNYQSLFNSPLPEDYYTNRLKYLLKLAPAPLKAVSYEQELQAKLYVVRKQIEQQEKWDGVLTGYGNLLSVTDQLQNY